MPGHLRWDLNGNKRFSNIVSPEQMEDFQWAHHEDHKEVREVKHTQLELTHWNPTIIKKESGRRNYAYCDEQKDPATTPTDKGMHVYHIQ